MTPRAAMAALSRRTPASGASLHGRFTPAHPRLPPNPQTLKLEHMPREQTSGQKGNILLVEDHQELAGTVGDFLEARGYAVDYAADGLLALHLAATQPFDAIVLDLMLPGVDGITVCKRLRKDAQLTTPILMLTARDQLDDKLAGFDVGADDYLVKPFDLPELVARIEALMRRGRGMTSTYSAGDLTINLDTMEVHRAGVEIKLSRTLFDILRILLREAPKVVPRETIERELWGDDLPDSDTLRSHLYNLRRAVDKPFDFPMIETLAGRGYRIRTADAADAGA
jgi:DNA-binding response OmpR family regulator